MKLEEIRYIGKDQQINEPDPHKRDIKIALREATLLGQNPEIVFESDGTVSIVNGGIQFKNLEWRHLPEVLKFKAVEGSFIMKNCKVSSWEGFPSDIGGDLEIDGCRFTDMRGSPEMVQGRYIVKNCRLKSLRGFTTAEVGFVDLSDNDLTSLEYGPEFVDDDYIIDGNQIQSMKGFPQNCGGKLSIRRDHHLESFEGVEKEIGFCEDIDAAESEIKSHVLGLLQVEGLKNVTFKPSAVCNIVRKHLSKDEDEGGDVFACQQELIDAGFEEYAQL